MTADVVPLIPGVPVLDFDSVPMGVDRGRGWAVVREAGPVVKMGDFYYVTRREDVVDALRRPELFSSKKAFDILGSPIPLVPISFDPPDHTRYRKILQPFFSPRTLGAMLPSLQQQIEDLIDDLAAAGECEAVSGIAEPYPSQVFLTLFGLPVADRDRLMVWKDAVIALADSPNLEGVDLTPALELFTYLNETIAARRKDPGEDILSQLITGEEALNDQDAIGLSFLFVLAGLDTVTASIGFALHELARDPELRRSLVADPERIPEFVEEVVRLEPPAPVLPRVTTAEVTIGGVTLPPDTFVRLCLGSANREEGLVATPDDVLLDGVAHRHWGFGGGPHRCLGSHLARMELKLVVTEWLRRVPEFELAPGTEPRIPFPANTFSLQSLPLRYPVTAEEA
ncbi:cytochrome P450 [Pseudonocardia sp.]|jgi:cytochrome P450|uniref:cytochrome P450 n=1 Tax=Pseudonocardia sp. TaxID=60912 RepID=UPI00260ED147|nr:cytochrome P450 [Pseudonocardia sp.]MCW2722952.1 putative cytochrome [Pseudonocardia sp.]